MTKKKVDILHIEKDEECFEILKSTIVEDKELKKYRIDKHTLLQELPESIVNEFLDFLGSDEQYRSLMLYMIKKGTLVITCWEDEDNNIDKRTIDLKARFNKLKHNSKNKLNYYEDDSVDFDVPF